MKTTVDLPGELYGRAKGEAALRGQSWREHVAAGAARVLETPGERTAKPRMSVLTERARGVMASEVSDLASNPKHLSGFGRDARHR